MAPESQFNIYGDIAKFDAVGDYLLVSGILSTPREDNQGEIVEPDAMRKALGAFLKDGVSREMHSPIAAGRPIEAHIDEEGRTHVTVKVVDKSTIQKINEKVLRGFSIGAEALKKVGKRITELNLIDASIVDRPANPDCVFTVIKFDKPEDRCSDPECRHHVEGHKEKCGMCKRKAEKEKHSEHSMKKMLCKAWGLPDATTDEDFEKEVIKRMAAPPAPAPAPDAAAAAIIAKMDALTKSVETLSQKATAATAAATESERKQVIEKMDRQGRVPMKEDGTAYKLTELQALELPVLKMLAVNSPVLPLQSKAIYKADGRGPAIDPKLSGFDLVHAAFAQQLPKTIEELEATPTGQQPTRFN